MRPRGRLVELVDSFFVQSIWNRGISIVSRKSKIRDVRHFFEFFGVAGGG